MLLDVLGFFVMMVVAALAFGGGMWFANYRASLSPSRRNEESEDVRRARDALFKIHDVASRVAADVDEHSSRVREINNELGAGDGSEAEVVAAITKLIASNEHMQKQLDSAEEKLQQQAVEIKTHAYEARTDALTKTPNRRALDVVLARCVADFNRDGRSASVVMIDIDHFKKVNDFHGHQAGDAVLSEAAQVIKRALPESAFVGRYGGEEFAIIFQGMSISDAVKKAEHARRQIQQTRFSWRGKELRITVSTGVAEVQEGDDVAMLIHRADKALYQSKQSSRNCGHWHDGETIRRIGLDHVIATKKRVAGDSPNGKPGEAGHVDQPAGKTSHVKAPDGKTPDVKATAGITSDAKAPDGKTPDGRLPEAKPEENPVGHAPGAPAAEKTGEVPPAGEELGLLAKLSDRESFAGDVRRRLAEWGRGGAVVSVVMIRVDKYQEIIRQRGPEAGDAVLKTCVQFIQAAMRDLDLVARWDSETFALLLPGAKLAGATAVADRLQQAITRCRERAGGSRLGLMIRCGAAEACEGEDTDALLNRCAASLGGGAASDSQHRDADSQAAPGEPDDAKTAAVGSSSA